MGRFQCFLCTKDEYCLHEARDHVSVCSPKRNLMTFSNFRVAHHEKRKPARVITGKTSVHSTSSLSDCLTIKKCTHEWVKSFTIPHNIQLRF